MTRTCNSEQWERIQEALERYGNKHGTEAQLDQVMSCLELALDQMPPEFRESTMDAIEEDLKEAMK